MRKSGAKRKSKYNPLARIEGLSINYLDSDPLNEGEDQSTIKALPYGHKNPALIPIAMKIFKSNRENLFNNAHKRVITVTPISIENKPMREPMQHISVCQVDKITDSVLDYIEKVMSEIDLDFYQAWFFQCEISK